MGRFFGGGHNRFMRWRRLDALVFFVVAALTSGCATRKEAVRIKDFQGLWVSNDLYLKLEGHPETQDSDENLPKLRMPEA